MVKRIVLGMATCLLLGVALVAMPTSQADAQTSDLCTTKDAAVNSPDLSNEAKAMLVLGSFATGDTAAIESYVSPDTYIQHNLGAPDGRAALISMIPGAAKDGHISTRRVLVMGDLVALHNDYNLPAFGGALVGFDVFRFKDGKIVEHWDNLMPRADPNASGHTETDGPVAVKDLDKTQANCDLVVDFLTRSLINYDAKMDITKYISSTTYIQHNPGSGDGLPAFQSMLQAMAKNKMVMSYSKIHFVVAQGNFVMTAAEGVFGNAAALAPTAFYDLFRVENGLIVEHWDAISTIPPQAQWQNKNGKF